MTITTDDEITILGIDPGQTSGVVTIACVPFDDLVGMASAVAVIEHDQIDLADAPHYLQERVRAVDLVAAEKFTITAATVTKTRQNAPLYVIGGVLFLCELASVPAVLQTPADAKTAFSDEILRELHLHGAVTGPHARDALRQALLAARRHYDGVYRSRREKDEKTVDYHR